MSAPPVSATQSVIGGGSFFRPKGEQLDWDRVLRVDLEDVVARVDVGELQANMVNITCADISEHDIPRFTPKNIIQLFRLCQLIIEYGVHSQQYVIQLYREKEDKYRRALAAVKAAQRVYTENQNKVKKLAAELEATQALLNQARSQLQDAGLDLEESNASPGTSPGSATNGMSSTLRSELHQVIRSELAAAFGGTTSVTSPGAVAKNAPTESKGGAGSSAPTGALSANMQAAVADALKQYMNPWTDQVCRQVVLTLRSKGSQGKDSFFPGGDVYASVSTAVKDALLEVHAESSSTTTIPTSSSNEEKTSGVPPKTPSQLLAPSFLDRFVKAVCPRMVASLSVPLQESLRSSLAERRLAVDYERLARLVSAQVSQGLTAQLSSAIAQAIDRASGRQTHSLTETLNTQLALYQGSMQEQLRALRDSESQETRMVVRAIAELRSRMVAVQAAVHEHHRRVSGGPLPVDSAAMLSHEEKSVVVSDSDVGSLGTVIGASRWMDVQPIGQQPFTSSSTVATTNIGSPLRASKTQTQTATAASTTTQPQPMETKSSTVSTTTTTTAYTVSGEPVTVVERVLEQPSSENPLDPSNWSEQAGRPVTTSTADTSTHIVDLNNTSLVSAGASGSEADHSVVHGTSDDLMSVENVPAGVVEIVRNGTDPVTTTTEVTAFVDPNQTVSSVDSASPSVNRPNTMQSSTTSIVGSPSTSQVMQSPMIGTPAPPSTVSTSDGNLSDFQKERVRSALQLLKSRRPGVSPAPSAGEPTPSRGPFKNVPFVQSRHDVPRKTLQDVSLGVSTFMSQAGRSGSPTSSIGPNSSTESLPSASPMVDRHTLAAQLRAEYAALSGPGVSPSQGSPSRMVGGQGVYSDLPGSGDAGTGRHYREAYQYVQDNLDQAVASFFKVPSPVEQRAQQRREDLARMEIEIESLRATRHAHEEARRRARTSLLNPANWSGSPATRTQTLPASSSSNPLVPINWANGGAEASTSGVNRSVTVVNSNAGHIGGNSGSTSGSVTSTVTTANPLVPTSWAGGGTTVLHEHSRSSQHSGRLSGTPVSAGQHGTVSAGSRTHTPSGPHPPAGPPPSSVRSGPHPPSGPRPPVGPPPASPVPAVSPDVRPAPPVKDIVLPATRHSISGNGQRQQETGTPQTLASNVDPSLAPSPLFPDVEVASVPVAAQFDRQERLVQQMTAEAMRRQEQETLAQQQQQQSGQTGSDDAQGADEGASSGDTTSESKQTQGHAQSGSGGTEEAEPVQPAPPTGQPPAPQPTSVAAPARAPVTPKAVEEPMSPSVTARVVTSGSAQTEAHRTTAQEATLLPKKAPRSSPATTTTTTTTTTASTTTSGVTPASPGHMPSPPPRFEHSYREEGVPVITDKRLLPFLPPGVSAEDLGKRRSQRQMEDSDSAPPLPERKPARPELVKMDSWREMLLKDERMQPEVVEETPEDMGIVSFDQSSPRAASRSSSSPGEGSVALPTTAAISGNFAARNSHRRDRSEDRTPPGDVLSLTRRAEGKSPTDLEPGSQPGSLGGDVNMSASAVNDSIIMQNLSDLSEEDSSFISSSPAASRAAVPSGTVAQRLEQLKATQHGVFKQ